LRANDNKDYMWITVEKGGAQLAMLDAQGKARLALFANEEGPGLIFYDANSRPRAELAVDKGGARLEFKDENGKTVFSKRGE